jgi:hypothetical protein
MSRVPSPDIRMNVEVFSVTFFLAIDVLLKLLNFNFYFILLIMLPAEYIRVYINITKKYQY